MRAATDPLFFARSAVRHPRRITGNWSAGLRPASRGSAKPATSRAKLEIPPGARRQVPIASLPFCERGESPLSHFPPGHAGSERSSLPFVFFAHSAVRHHAQNHGTTWSAGAGLRPASGSHGLRGIARQRETRPDNAAPRQSHGCEPTHRQPRRITWAWSAGRRWGPPTGIARERETCTDDARHANLKPAPTTPRHANLTARSAGLRPASRGSAKPAPTTLRHANLTAANPRIADREESRGRLGAPVSDRHRAGARNLHRRRCASPLSALTRVPPPTARFPGC